MRTDIARVVWAAGLVALWLGAPAELLSARADPPPMKPDTPNQLTKVPVPHSPNCLNWSPDGVYLAAGAWGWGPLEEKSTTSEIAVVTVARASVATTLEVAAKVNGLAFSPDGKWLVVGTGPSLPYSGDAPGELVVFDVPAFTRKHTAKLSGTKGGFTDFAWCADGKTLCAIEGSALGREKNRIRRWTLPGFTEQPAIRTPQTGQYRALALSPDGGTLAVADDPGVLRLLDVTTGRERASFKVARGFDRVGFTPDGKTVAIIEANVLSFQDPATGKPAKPDPARVAIPPAGLSDSRSGYAVSPDGSKQVRASERHPTIVFQKESKTEHGAFVHITDAASGKTWNWRVGETKGATDQPVLALSADGAKLAGTVRLPDGQAIVIWSMPK